MAHLVDKEFVERANTVLLLGILWTWLMILLIGSRTGEGRALPHHQSA